MRSSSDWQPPVCTRANEKAILVGIFAATILRIGFASITVQLLEIIGLLLAGGILLLWVCWKMWRELRTSPAHHQNAKAALNDQDINADGMISGPSRKTLGQAIWQITIADVSMSLDNVLAVAGAAREHPLILVFGLGLSIALMGLAASFIARLLQKHRWIAYIGRLIILYVAFDMCTAARRRFGRTSTFKRALIGIGQSAPIQDR